MLLYYAECGRPNESFDVFNKHMFYWIIPRKTFMYIIYSRTYGICNRSDEFIEHNITYFRNYLLLLYRYAVRSIIV